MTEDKSGIAREKLALLTTELKRSADKIAELAQSELSQDDQDALGALNDRVALYLQDIILMVSDDRALDIPAVIEFIDLVEHFVNEVDNI
jgi:hypothetical protein